MARYSSRACTSSSSTEYSRRRAPLWKLRRSKASLTARACGQAGLSSSAHRTPPAQRHPGRPLAALTTAETGRPRGCMRTQAAARPRRRPQRGRRRARRARARRAAPRPGKRAAAAAARRRARPLAASAPAESTRGSLERGGVKSEACRTAVQEQSARRRGRQQRQTHMCQLLRQSASLESANLVTASLTRTTASQASSASRTCARWWPGGEAGRARPAPGPPAAAAGSPPAGAATRLQALYGGVGPGVARERAARRAAQLGVPAAEAARGAVLLRPPGRVVGARLWAQGPRGCQPLPAPLLPARPALHHLRQLCRRQASALSGLARLLQVCTKRQRRGCIVGMLGLCQRRGTPGDWWNDAGVFA